MKHEISSLGSKIFIINFREARIQSKNGTQLGMSEEWTGTGSLCVLPHRVNAVDEIKLVCFSSCKGTG